MVGNRAVRLNETRRQGFSSGEQARIQPLPSGSEFAVVSKDDGREERNMFPPDGSRSIGELCTTAVELPNPGMARSAAGGGDWVTQVANPLPTRAIALVVGLPLDDVDRLLEWAMARTRVPAGSTTFDGIGAAAETGEMVE